MAWIRTSLSMFTWLYALQGPPRGRGVRKARASRGCPAKRRDYAYSDRDRGAHTGDNRIFRDSPDAAPLLQIQARVTADVRGRVSMRRYCFKIALRGRKSRPTDPSAPSLIYLLLQIRKQHLN